MLEIESQGEKSVHRANKFFKMSLPEGALYLLLSLILLIIYNISSVLHGLGSDYIGDPEKIQSGFSTLSTGFSNSFSTALGGRLGQILLWSFVGALTYLALWLSRNVINSFKNDIISDHYLHPSSYNRAEYWGSSLSVKLFFAAQLMISAAYAFVVLRAVLPSMAALAGSAAYHFHWATSPLYILFSIVSVALVLYIGVVLFRLVAHLWRLL
jgi:hypothetical protein